ncbi:uncharacterized protein BJX67DRAFT_364452 [Aspergillus lucknowensis]|uniref:C2H2-type domain-containing protein n=1 Tax=Aspergillus lucknowensis TaxID=176173 RepID=A0ABR4LFR5_9EURO
MPTLLFSRGSKHKLWFTGYDWDLVFDNWICDPYGCAPSISDWLHPQIHDPLVHYAATLSEPHGSQEPCVPLPPSNLPTLDISASPQIDIDTPSFSETSSQPTLKRTNSSPESHNALTPKSGSVMSTPSVDLELKPRPIHRNLIPSHVDAATPLSPLLCKFCGETFQDEAVLLHHEARAHRYRCELGCPDKGFSTLRNRSRHYGSKAHEQSQILFQFGSCGGQFSGERRDNYLRHLKSCDKGYNLQYICGRDSNQTLDKAAHIDHVKACKGAAGRKRSSPTANSRNEEPS